MTLQKQVANRGVLRVDKTEPHPKETMGTFRECGQYPRLVSNMHTLNRSQYQIHFAK